jgi:outer membrane lipoprotein-sorting protein
LLAQPAKEIANTQVLRGRFLHRKFLSEIPAPLEATGEFVFIRGQGLYWHTIKPFESVFVLTPQGMTQQDEGGKSFKMDAAEQPGVRAAAQIFMALFSVDLKALDNDFHLFGAPAGSGWQLGLRPKNAAMSQVFTEAVVSGAAQVQQVELHDAHGDRTVIQLLDPQLLTRPPTAQERALLSR